MEMQTQPTRKPHSTLSRWLSRLGALTPLALLAGVLLAAPAVALAASPSSTPTPTKAPTTTATTPTLTSANPDANKVETKAPTSVTLTFSENLSSSGSNVAVYDAKGNVVSTGSVTVKGATMTEGVKPDGNGSYLVVWHATTATGNKLNIGAYTFAIGAASVPTGEVGSTSASTPTNMISWWWALVTGVAGLIVGAVASRFRGMSLPSARPAQSARPARPARTDAQK
jgi:methionine-rich copper-binding protein CopC